jgi:hypothetical protein
MSSFLPLLTSLLIASQGVAVQPEPQPRQPPLVTFDDVARTGHEPAAMGISVQRIRRALSEAPAITLDRGGRVFRLEVFGKEPSSLDLLSPEFRESLRGPVPHGAVTHQEFLAMVTPTDVQGYAAFTNRQGMAVATMSATSVILQRGVRKAIERFNGAQSARAREAARGEVVAALGALQKARRDAGLPDK